LQSEQENNLALKSKGLGKKSKKGVRKPLDEEEMSGSDNLGRKSKKR
jgi:hypothetical protein